MTVKSRNKEFHELVDCKLSYTTKELGKANAMNWKRSVIINSDSNKRNKGIA